MSNHSKIMSKKVVVIGGGNGSAITLQALKKFVPEIKLTGVVSVSDSAGSSGKLRIQFNTLPAGDILRAVLALSKYDYNFLKKIFYNIRFSEVGKLNEHNLGNLFLVLTQQLSGSWTDSITALEQAVEAEGKIMPTTLDNTNLVAELNDGLKIKGEGLIDRPNYNRTKKIKKVWLEPKGKIYIGAKKSIEEADYIFLGPGSLFCSIVATLLPLGVKEAIKKSKAKLVYIVGNAYETIGETGPTILSDFIFELENYLPRPLDLVVYNNHKLSDEQLKKYHKKNWDLIKADMDNLFFKKIIQGNYEKEEGGLDPNKLSKILKKILS